MVAAAMVVVMEMVVASVVVATGCEAAVMMSMAWGDGDGGVDGVAVAVVGVATKTRGGEWVWGSGRSGDGDPFWCWPEKPAGKVFRRRLAGKGGGRRELHYLLGKVVSVGTAPGPNSSDHNVNTITNGDGMPRMRTFREIIFPE
ncbi:hypothetical protein Tco_0374029 [Tanacetum coccineum]